MTKEQIEKEFIKLRKHYEDLDFVKDFVEKLDLTEKIESFISSVRGQVEQGCYPSFIGFIHKVVETSGAILARNFPFAYFASDEAQVDENLARSEIAGHLFDTVTRFKELGGDKILVNPIKFYLYKENSDEIEIDLAEGPDKEPVSVDLFVAKILAYEPYVYMTEAGTTVRFCCVAKDIEANSQRKAEYLASLSPEDLERGNAIVNCLKNNYSLNKTYGLNKA